MHIVRESEEKILLGGRYWNTNGVAIAIVAVATKEVDWAAYIGAAIDTRQEISAYLWTSDYGAKLSEKEARFFFPSIELPYRE